MDNKVKKVRLLESALSRYEKILNIRHDALKVILEIDEKVSQQKIKKFKEKIKRAKK